MKWKDAFDRAMEELKAIRALLAPVGRLDDPTVGLTALHGELAQTRLKILETVQGGITGLREENREVRRRQDRMISDLNETRGELRQLLELADVLRPLADLQGQAEESGDGTSPYSPAEPAPVPETDPGTGLTVPTAAQLPTSPATDSQGGAMEDNDRQAQSERRGQDDVLKQKIEAAYQGNSTPTAQPSAVVPPATADGQDPLVTHGVLLLKAAGVASVDLVAHRDTWEWLTALAVDHDHFRTPPSVEDVKEGRVQTVLSGRSLIGLLIKLWDTRHATTPLEADWALATTAYNRIAAELTGVDGGGQTIRIVLDDGLPHETGD
ncbi:hypothetical protein [Streptomyces sp. ADI93-02]|uniref:hypothetical protein n=1 Tax=Streptomyces sp. ADI93-02 TaxID=1522757 RepID=UPI000FA9DFFA|nr:hypothetical protein [Streptomyces sp. ADI93-02]RPK32085.1 hypothetical protein EES40_36870 [Streptomyces sp. ADI93-02]